MKSKTIFSGEILVVLCASLWGVISLFTIPLINIGFNSLQITFIRSLFSCLFIGAYILIFNKNLFKIQIKDIFILLFLGAVCYCFMCAAYSFSMKENGAGLSSMLLYTSPIWTILLSMLIFNDKIGLKEIVCLFGIVIGCALISLRNINRTSQKGIAIGLLSGFLLASYGVVSKLLSSRYRAITITFYSFLFSMIASFFCSKGWKIFLQIKTKPQSISYFILLSVFITSIPYLLYNYALNDISSSRASMISSIEIVIASVCGVMAFNNSLSFQEILGILLQVVSIILINVNFKIKKINKKYYLKN